MATTAKINVKHQDFLASLQAFFKSVLQQNDIGALLVPQHLPMKDVVMPTIVTDPEALDAADPLAPTFPLNAATLLSRLTRKPLETTIAAVLRPCEIRAFIELVKLKQGRTENLIIIGTDCLGAYPNNDYARVVEKEGSETTRKFYQNVLSGKNPPLEGFQVARACQACEHPVPEGADIVIELFGVDTEHEMFLEARTPAGEKLLAALNLPSAKEPDQRKKAIQTVVNERITYRDQMFDETRKRTETIEKLTRYLAGCVNCYNCRVACPVCYCRECVFVTDVFDHEPSQYLRWADRKKSIKLPTDTIFYHLTRLSHISTACVGCGQCTNACPNNIPVMELFRMVAHKTQQAFDYEPGRSLEEPPPLSVFKETEFPDLTGETEQLNH